jgi:hypothetical protein
VSEKLTDIHMHRHNLGGKVGANAFFFPKKFFWATELKRGK